MNYLLVAIGGAIGSVLRYAITLMTYQELQTPVFPWGTMLVNLSGSLLIGVLAGINETDPFHPGLRLFIFVGLLGGYTTFSSFSLETINLFRNNLYFYAFMNIMISNVVGILLAFGGFYCSRMIFQLSR